MQTNFTRQAAQGPAHGRDRQDPAQVRALRLLHRHVPHLRAARRRARQSARPHLPDEGDVRTRTQGHARRAAARRPLPVVPVVHDDLPERRRLHAPRRPRPRAHRGDGHAQLQGSCDPARCWRRPCPIPSRFRLALVAARLARPFTGLLRRLGAEGTGGHAAIWRPRACCAVPTSAAPAPRRPRASGASA